MLFSCPINTACVVNCDAADSCKDVYFDGRDGAEFTIICSAESSCANAEIYCPNTGECQTSCENEACNGFTNIYCGSGVCAID